MLAAEITARTDRSTSASKAFPGGGLTATPSMHRVTERSRETVKGHYV